MLFNQIEPDGKYFNRSLRHGTEICFLSNLVLGHTGYIGTGAILVPGFGTQPYFLCKLNFMFDNSFPSIVYSIHGEFYIHYFYFSKYFPIQEKTNNNNNWNQTGLYSWKVLYSLFMFLKVFSNPKAARRVNTSTDKLGSLPSFFTTFSSSLL